MKQRLGDLVAATLACHDGGDAKALAADLTHAGAALPHSDGHYGVTIAFDVRYPRPDLIAVTAGIAIACGSDTMLMVFARSGAGWREALRLQSKPYDTVAGGYDAFDYVVSAPDARGRWFVVQKNIMPWCSSTWTSVRYQVARPSDDPREPRILLSATDPLWFGGDDVGRLALDVNGFTLRFHAESIDGDVHNREYVRHVRVDADHVTRIAPFANSPRDFAEEWIQSDWATVAPWTAMPGLQAEHDAMHKHPYFAYVSMRRCAGARMQVEFSQDDAPGSDLLIDTRGAYRLLGVRHTPDQSCNGPNLYKMP
jgi:hypothetical protein